MRKIYNKAFKEKAVQLSYDRANTSELSWELGVTAPKLYKWSKEYQELGEGSFQGKGNLKLTPEQEKFHELEKRLKDAELERDILKKALGIFSTSGRWFIVSLKTMNNYSWLKKCAKLNK